MNREIKFRGQHGGMWVYGNLLDTGSTSSPRDFFILPDYADNFDEYVEVAPATVGQFTGLRDSKGVDIYEGDRWSYQDEVGVVYYKDGEFNCTEDYSLYCMAEELEIAGNIHDKDA